MFNEFPAAKTPIHAKCVIGLWGEILDDKKVIDIATAAMYNATRRPDSNITKHHTKKRTKLGKAVN